jgi:hypothetical protein
VTLGVGSFREFQNLFSTHSPICPYIARNALAAVRRYAFVVQRHCLVAVLLLLGVAGTPAQEDRTEISGSILSWAEQPIVGVQVRVRGTDYLGFTGPDGSYRIRDLDSGVYDLEVLATGFYAVTIRPVALGVGEVKALSAIRLKVGLIEDCGSDRPDYYRPSGGGGTGAVGGVVMSDKKAFSQNATVTLYLKGKGRIATTVTGEDGRFSFSGLQPRREEYWLTIAHEGTFSEELRHLQVQPGFEAVYDPMTLESCSPGRCEPHLKTIRVIPPCE